MTHQLNGSVFSDTTLTAQNAEGCFLTLKTGQHYSKVSQSPRLKPAEAVEQRLTSCQHFGYWSVWPLSMQPNWTSSCPTSWHSPDLAKFWLKSSPSSSNLSRWVPIFKTSPLKIRMNLWSWKVRNLRMARIRLCSHSLWIKATKL